MDLGLVEDAVLVEEGDVLGLDHGGQGVRRGLEVGQAAALGLLLPLLGVAVALEDDAVVVPERLLDPGQGAGGELVTDLAGHGGRELVALLGHGGIQHHLSLIHI